jgi:UDP-N-acetyl-D-glucosamine dehydrogenase
VIDELKRRIRTGEARVGILGLGYVGLPLAMEFVRGGLSVTGFDVTPSKVDLLNRGESHIADVAASRVKEAVQAGKFQATVNFDRLAEVDAISICVPTPLSKTRDPDMSFVEAAAREVVKRLRRGQVVVLESTTYPGTTVEVLLPMLEAGGLKCGVDFFLAFSPERVDPGNPVYGVRNTPKVLGGITPACTEVASLLYGAAVDRVVPVSSAGTAEMVKLLENTFRSVNIGLVNEVAIMCDHLGLSAWEVIDAAATKPFGFMAFRPGPGLGGHCIPIDPLYLSWKLRTLNYRARFIELADAVNAEMPEHVVRKVVDALNDRSRSVRGSRILMLGIAYKKDIEDLRESPALEILELLDHRGAVLTVCDPHTGPFTVGERTWTPVPLTEAALRAADLVLVTTDHSAFDWDMVAKHSAVVVDTRNALAKFGTTSHIIRL